MAASKASHGPRASVHHSLNRNRRRARGRSQGRPALAAVAAAAISAYSLARTGLSATVYWDPNGTSLAGTYTANWDNVTSDWSTNTTGTAASTWVPGSDAYFVAPTTGTDSMVENIVVNGNQAANSLQLNSATDNFTGAAGATLSLGAGGITMTANASNVGNPSFASSLPFVLTANQIWNLGDGGTLNHNLTFSGTIAGSAVAGSTLIFNLAPFAGDISGNDSPTIGGSIGDGTAGGNLAFYEVGSGITNFSGSNTYSGGTNVERGLLSLGSAATLGTGTVHLDAGELSFNSTANYSGANYTTANGFLVGPRAGIAISNTAIIPGTSGTSAFPGSPTVTLPIDPNSSGFFAFGGVNTISESGSINLAHLGNGSMFFGSDGGSGGNINNGGTYSASTMGAGSGNVYRLGAGLGALKLTANNVLSNVTNGSLTTDSLVIGEPLSTVANTLGIGTVILNASINTSTNSFSGGTTVNLGSTLETGGNTGSPTGSPLGSGSITLLGSRLQGDGSTSANITLLTPDVYFTGDSSVSGLITNSASFAGIETISLSGVGTVGLTRQNQGILQISVGGGSFNVIGTNTKVVVANNAPATTAINGGSNTMIAPYYVDGSGNFLTYTSGVGFTAATAGPATIGASSNTNDYVKTAAADTTAATKTIYALDAGGTITTASGGPVSLTLASGGLTLQSGNVGTAAAATNVNLIFGTGGTGAEALIYNGGSSTIFGTITGNSGLTKSGGGNLSLTPDSAGVATSNAFTGTVTVNAGVLSPFADVALGASSNAILLNGGTLNFPNSFTLVSTRTLTLGAAGGFITGSTKTATIASYVTTGGGSTSAPFLDINDALSAGTVIVSNATNDFTAPIFVEGITTLSIAADADLGNAANSVTLNGLIGGTATNMYIPTLQATSSVTSARNIALSGVGAQIDTTANTLTLNGVVSGDAILTKVGAGTLILGGTNTYGGETIVSAGILQIGAGTTSGQLGTGSVTSAGPIYFDRSNNYTAANLISGAGSLTQEGAGTLTLTASNTYTGTTTLAAGELDLGVAETAGTSGPLGKQAANAANTIILNGGYLQYSSLNQNDYSGRFSTAASQQYNVDTNGQTVTFATALTSSGGSLSKIGAGTLTLTVPNSYTAGTTVGGGTLTDSAGGVAGAYGSGNVTVTPTGTLSTQSAELIANANTSIAPTATVTVNDNSLANGTVIFNGTAPTIATLSGTGNVVLAGTSGTALTTGTSGNPTFSGVISDDGTLTNSGSITVTGSGTFTMAGTSTYFGSTNVSGGTLNITGALTNSATVNVNNSSNLVLAGATALPSSAIVNVGSLASAFVNSAQTITSIASAGNATFTAGTSIVGTGNGIGTGAGGGSTTGGISGTGTLTVNGTANLYAANITQSVLNIGATSTVTIADSASPGNSSSVSVLTDINNTGTLDLNNNDLIVTDSAQYSTIKALINNAADGGAWDQPGITSSSARANTSTYGLGYAPASAVGTTVFDGVTLAGTETIVKYTILGDTQLRGAVGIGDYDTVLSNYGTGTDWSQGNFHYSGVVGIGDYDDVLSNYGAHPSGNLVAGPALTRSLSPALSLSPDAAKSDMKLEVNTVTGDVYLQATTTVAFAGYTISDPSAHLLAGSTSPDPAKLLSVAPGNGGNTNSYETGTTYINWFKISETSIQLSEGQNNNGFANHSSRDDTINVPAGGTIDFGDIYNTAVNNQDISFDFAEAGTTPTNGPAYYGAEVDYVGGAQTPEPASVSLLAIGAVGMLARRRRRQQPINSSSV